MKFFRTRKTVFLAMMAFGALAAPFNLFASQITLKVDQNYLDSLSDERKEVLESIIAAFKAKNLNSLSDYEIKLPDSLIANREGKIFELSSFFILPKGQSTDDVRKLAYDNQGQRLALSQTQIDAIANEGVFTVESKEFPGQFHVWKINTILQKGEKNITISFEKDLSTAAGHILIHMPHTFLDKDKASVVNGLSHISQGLRGILASVIGLVEKAPKYSEYEITNLLQQRRTKFVVEALTQEAAQASGSDKAISFDPRLFDEELSKKVSTEIHRIQQEHSNSWGSELTVLRRSIRKAIRDAHPEMSTSKLVELVTTELKDREFSTLNQSFVSDKKLQALSPGYGLLYANNRIALEIGSKVEENLKNDVTAHAENYKQKLINEHTILSKNEDWLQEKVALENQKYYQSVRWDYLSNIPKTLEAMGLSQEAKVYSKIMEFQKTMEEKITAELTDEKGNAREFSFAKRIWDSNYYTPEVQVYDNKETHYTTKEYEVAKVSTDHWFWRFEIMKHETESNFKNGLYQLLVTNLWNGPVGLKALFSKDEFYASKHFDQTGKLVDNPNTKTKTYNSNLQGIWANVRKSRAEFEAEPETGVLGKGWTRWVNQLWNVGIKGGLGSLVVGIGQPLLTLCNLGVSCSVAATAPVWAPLSSVFRYGFGLMIYDLDGTNQPGQHNFLPLPRYCLEDVVCLGAGQTTFKVAEGLVFEPVAAGATGLYASVRKGVRTAYDAVLRQVISRGGNVPAENTWAAQHVKGPGTAAQHFYQIKPELVVLAVQARLESEELALVKSKSESEIIAPLNEYYKFFAEVVQPFGTINPTGSQKTKELTNERDEKWKELGTKVTERQIKLSKASSVPYEFSGIIKQSQEDLNHSIQLSAQLVASFFNDHLKPRLSSNAVATYWESKDMDENDFVELARYYVSRVFGDSFLQPLEEKDKELVVEVKQEGLEVILQNFPKL